MTLDEHLEIGNEECFNVFSIHFHPDSIHLHSLYLVPTSAHLSLIWGNFRDHAIAGIRTY
jgi:hypothetical protein